MKELSNRGVIELSYNDLTDEERDYVLNYSREYIKASLFSSDCRCHSSIS